MLNMKKGESVILKGFTGIKLGVFEVSGATKKTVSITKKNGDELVFDRKTGKQINVEEGKEKYANSIMENDGSFVAPSTKRAAKKTSKKPAKAAPVVEEDEDEEEEEVKPVKKSKAAPKKTSKKKAAPVVEEDEDDDDDFEEIDDEDEED